MGSELMDQLTMPENLLAAWRAVRGNIPQKRRHQSAGPDGITLTEYERDLTANLDGLRTELAGGRYESTPPARIEMPKRGGGRRVIGILTVKDRVAQRAAHHVLEPLFEPTFLDCSFGFRPGRSVAQALEYATAARQNGLPWVVDGDIADCFGTLDHERLMTLLAGRIKEQPLLDLIWGWLSAGILPAGPPSPEDDLPPDWWRVVRSGTQTGFNWTLEALLAQTNEVFSPYPSWTSDVHYDPESGYDSYEGPSAASADLKKVLLKQLVVGGVALGLSSLRSVAGKAAGAAGEAMRTPHGRHSLRKHGLTAGGIAGTAALAAAGVYALSQHKSSGAAGTLQGSPLSPLLANIYLHPFDERMSQQPRRGDQRLVRYADDWLILCSNAKVTEAAYEEAIKCLGKLNLKINPVKTRLLSPHEPVNFLGGQIKAVP